MQETGRWREDLGDITSCMQAGVRFEGPSGELLIGCSRNRSRPLTPGLLKEEGELREDV